MTLFINVCLDAADRATVHIHRITVLRLGTVSLQWEDPAHAEAFLLGALESLRAERERYAQAGAA